MVSGSTQVKLTQRFTVNAGEMVKGSQTILETLPLGSYLVVFRTTFSLGHQTVATAVLTIVSPPERNGDSINDFDDGCPSYILGGPVIIDGCNSGALKQSFANGGTVPGDYKS